MGRWIVIMSLAVAQCADIAGAAPPTSTVPLPKPRPVRRDAPASAVKAVVVPLAARPIIESAEAAQADESAADSPVRPSAVEAPRAPTPAPAKTGPVNGDCNGGKRIMSAWYSQGSRTASGEPFNPQGMTAAHRTLPFGTRLTVSNPRTGKSVTVVINDRGPFVAGLSLDLSLGAAQAIGMRGTGAVCIQ